MLTEALRSGSQFKDEVPGLVAYVRELSGGLEQPFLLWELRDFLRGLQTVRVVKGNVMEAFANAELGSEGACPLARNAIV